MRETIAARLRDYGMGGVLVLLCLYYSWATYREQQPAGESAARILAQQLTRDFPPPAAVVIAARPAEQDVRFANTLEIALRNAGHVIAAKVVGDPRAARGALEKVDASGTAIAAIATTSEAAAWTVWENLPARFPNLGQPRVIYAASYKSPTFLRRENLLNIANQAVVVAILAVGMTLVIITGGIDLSVGSLIALSAVTATLLIRDLGGGSAAGESAMFWFSAAGVLGCAAIGMFSGLMVTWCRVPPFIATLAIMQVASGLAYIMAKGASIYEVPDSYTTLGWGSGWFGLPYAVILMGALYLAVHVVMSRTVLGRYIYAVGGNAETARLCGVRVGAVLVFVYTLSGALAGLGGIVMASQLKSGSPTYGGSYELYVIAAVVVGGTSLSGGEGRIFGTLIGTLIIAVIQNGMNLTGVESYTQKVVLGLVILGAVLLDSAKRSGWQRMFGRGSFRSISTQG